MAVEKPVQAQSAQNDDMISQAKITYQSIMSNG
jgi:hypothetical protein